ncbi:MAG: RnfABCDGE type electron transport complex subunit D [Desulfobacula sp.]|uniref:RnfABCDGE type electron transport complex subunit D n=1 Tax=Desulfobacula sp. TaxID=2593537 RepID=UPI001E088F34|nr:RnfABCDGE type electron transport complex subunit D [Desulfobacula sp.]MBT3487450.1 RnfABCDGE type electron transport complex subunit D [Desulfobacula sp.]MBT3804441.1 RnfABCDGE type electron transport complex subunit D [Desulfobacula sp.]MBT4024965.1 RnfABCDGE type electron transport complex subunit D [Desulfobacula sp.]MBT4198803.1 RnfABCDGE type electron transport complex subunit D [Desulfobacula sp.]
MPDSNKKLDTIKDFKSSDVKENTAIHVAPSPHIRDTKANTQKMMIDVLIALTPVVLVSVYLFRAYAVKQLLICLVSCLIAEYVFVRMRGRSMTLKDCSAGVTGIILALSLPGSAPWFVGVIASVVAMGIGKIIFGGLGMNIFNPAMVGRAFVMIAFAGLMSAGSYENITGLVDAVSGATPLSAMKFNNTSVEFSHLFFGNTNGSIGETSSAACIIGGLFLVFKKTASWQIPVSIVLTVLAIAGITDVAKAGSGLFIVHHLFSGALMFGAFFIATDPVTSPLTSKGKWIFGFGTGMLIMIIRLFSGYPEGVMFAVLMMNAVTPLINRWTNPQPMGEA